MKMRKMILASAFVLAIGASFAFTSKKQFFMTVTFHPTGYEVACADGILDDYNDCLPTNHGVQCTVADWSTTGDPQVPAFMKQNGGMDCYYPLYHEL